MCERVTDLSSSASWSPAKDAGDETYQSVHMPPFSSDRPAPSPSSSSSGDDGPEPDANRILRSNRSNKYGKRPSRPPSDHNVSDKKGKRPFSSVDKPEDEEADPDSARPIKQQRRGLGREFAVLYDENENDLALRERLIFQHGVSEANADAISRNPPPRHWQFGERPIVPSPPSPPPVAPAQGQAGIFRTLGGRPRPEPQPEVEDEAPNADNLPPPRLRRGESSRSSGSPQVVRRRIHAAQVNAEAGPSRIRSRPQSVQPSSPPAFTAPSPPIAGPSTLPAPRVFFPPPGPDPATAGPSAPQAGFVAPSSPVPGPSSPEQPATPAVAEPAPSISQPPSNSRPADQNGVEAQGPRLSVMGAIQDMTAGAGNWALQISARAFARPQQEAQVQNNVALWPEYNSPAPSSGPQAAPGAPSMGPLGWEDVFGPSQR